MSALVVGGRSPKLRPLNRSLLEEILEIALEISDCSTDVGAEPQRISYC